MKKRIVAVVLTMAMATTMLAGCGSSSSTGAEDGAKTIKIGVSGPTTGDSAESGVNVNTGIQMAVDDVNAEGGIEIDGEKRKVEVVYYDTGSDAQTGLSNCEKLITSDKVDFLWCEAFNSAVGIATMELAKKYDIPMATLEPVSSAITDKIVEDPDSYSNFFKFGWDSAAYGETCAMTIMDLVEKGEMSLPNKTIALCGDETDYARSNLTAVASVLEENGYTVVSENYWEFGATDLYSVISDIKNSGADVMFSCSTTAATGVALIKQLNENGMSNFPHMAIFYPSLPEFTSQIGTMADKLVWAPMTFDIDHNETVQAFASKLEEYNGDSLTFDHIDGYSDMYVVLEAIKRAGSLDADAIGEILLDPDGFDTPKGHIVFDPDNHQIITGDGYVPVNAAQIQGDTNNVIWPASAATADYIAKE